MGGHPGHILTVPDLENSSLVWYALQSRRNQEDALLQYLSHRQIEAYYPCIKVQPANPRMRKIKPYFPGYLFVHVDIAENTPHMFHWMPCASGLVCFDGIAAPVDDRLITGVQQAIATMAQHGKGVYEFEHGDRVRITGGLFEDYQAIFDARLSGQDRVRVLLETLRGRSILLETTARQLKRADSHNRV